MHRRNKYCHLYLVRHGETQWNLQRIMQGHQDSPLTQNGLKQAAALAQELKKITFAHVVSSDLLRARRTAEIIAADHKLVIKTSQFLRETYLGRFEGKSVEHFKSQLKDALEHRESLPTDQGLKYPLEKGLETYHQAATRMLTFLREVSLAYPGKNVLVVSHGGAIRSTLIKLGFATIRELPGNAIANNGYALIDCDGIDFFIRQTHGININSTLRTKNGRRKQSITGFHS